MKLGIVGLPNVGKSTLFNAITNAGAEAANYPFCTIDPNVGVVNVPDPRLDWLAELYHPAKYTPATIEFVDIAGLVKGASKGEGLGNKFLSHIREVDAIVHVVRCFESGDIVHVEGSVDPVRDIETVNLELILADMDTLKRRIDKTEKAAKGDKSLGKELELLQRVYSALCDEKPARSVAVAEDEEEVYSTLGLLTQKPVIYACNLGENDFLGGLESNEHLKRVEKLATEEGAEVFPICAELEDQIAGLSPEDKRLFLDDLGLDRSGLERLIPTCYRLLGLISFLTAGEQEVRAWTIKDGTKAPAAAGKIHSDFERGFIRAEVVPFETLKECGSLAAAKEKGFVRSEGKEYAMRDGDVVLFRFNV